MYICRERKSNGNTKYDNIKQWNYNNNKIYLFIFLFLFCSSHYLIHSLPCSPYMERERERKKSHAHRSITCNTPTGKMIGLNLFE